MLNTIAGIITGIISLTVSFITGSPSNTETTVPTTSSSSSQISTSIPSEGELLPTANSSMVIGELQSINKNSFVLLLPDNKFKTIFLSPTTDKPEDVTQPNAPISIGSLKLGKVLLVQFNQKTGSPIAERILQLGNGGEQFTPSGFSFGSGVAADASDQNQIITSPTTSSTASGTASTSRKIRVQEN